MSLRKGSLPMFPLAGVVAALCLACTDGDPFLPDLGAAQSPSSTASLTERGCARFQVKISGNDSIAIHSVDEEGCGGVRPVIVGNPTFDRTSQRVRLPIAMQNHTQGAVRAPAWMLSWEDSLTVLAPSGLAGNQHIARYLSLTNADSVAGAAGSTLYAARIWKYDHHLSGAGQSSTLPANQTSQPRWIEVAVHPGVQTFRIVLHAQASRPGAVVPLTAPYGIPEWVRDPWTHAPDKIERSSWITGVILKNVILMTFELSATQEQRQAAIDLIGGEVIGGLSGAEYLVKVADDGTSAPLRRALDRLNSLPQVGVAIPWFLDGMFQLMHRKPRDGSGWDRWQVIDTLADGRNWALEAISAPLAWGCETGDAARQAPVAVVDNGFHNQAADVNWNVNWSNSAGVGQFPAVQHGAVVASILGARGNDSTGITGTVWHVNLRLRDAGVDSSGAIQLNAATGVPVLHGLHYQLRRAILDGAAVVNLSLGVNWDAMVSSGYKPGTSQDTLRVHALSSYLLDAIRKAEQISGNQPLYVIAAGNNNLDAFWSAVPILADSIPTRTLVVGAFRNRRTGTSWSRASFSNHGARVQIMAPGEDVWALNQNGVAFDSSGTSFAAPYVSGVAALMESFDSRIPADTLRSLILEGARRGGRTAAGVPVLNAYETAKLAAQREDAPLCGNRIWTDGNRVFAERAGGSRQLVTNTQLDTIYDVKVYHGGRRLSVQALGTGRVEFLWNSGQWLSVPSNAPSLARFPIESGAYMSSIFRSHDGDTIYGGQAVDLSSGVTRMAVVRYTANWSLIDTLAVFDRPTNRIVHAKVPSNSGKLDDGSPWEPEDRSHYTIVIAPSPVGDRVLVAISKGEQVQTIGPSYSCMDGLSCRDLIETLQWNGSEFFSIRVGDKRVSHIHSDATGFVTTTAVSEDGNEMAFYRVAWTQRIQWPAVPWENPQGQHSATCEMQYLHLATRTASTYGTCRWGSFSTVGTFSPSINSGRRAAPNGGTPFFLGASQIRS